MANSLADLRAQLGQQTRLLDLLDPFGDHLEAEIAGHLDHVRRHRAAGGFGTQGIDKTLVDLQHIHRQLLQVGQAGIAGTEVVDGDAVAIGAQLPQQTGGQLDIDQATLRHLPDQLPRRHAGLTQQTARRFSKSRSSNIGGGQIDRDV